MIVHFGPPAYSGEAIPWEQTIATVAGDAELATAIAATIATESSFDPLAIGPQGELGLAQLSVPTRRSLGLTDEQALDPDIAIQVCADLLRQLRAGGRSWADVACAYNCGGSPCRCKRADGSYSNAAHVSRWLGNFERYRGIFGRSTGGGSTGGGSTGGGSTGGTSSASAPTILGLPAPAVLMAVLVLCVPVILFLGRHGPPPSKYSMIEARG